MNKRFLFLLSASVAALAAWFGATGQGGKTESKHWVQISPGVLRTTAMPFGHALVDGNKALLIDVPAREKELAELAKFGVKTIDLVLLTHHHRDTCAGLGDVLAKKIKVRAPKASAEWLNAENVRKYWQESIPLRHSRANYFVVPVGFEGIDCSLQDGQTIAWSDWKIQVISTPGHSRDHVSYAARKGENGKLLVFCGDALAAPGKIWAPYTSDWDHWTDAGLAPAAKSLRELAKLKPAVLLPARGEVIDKNVVAALEKTAVHVEDVGFLKSFERFTKERLGNAPKYKFLVPEQAKSNGSLPWSQVSKNLFVTGNTYVLVSKDNTFMVIDPWGDRSVKQIVNLKQERKLGKLEVVVFSHAHYDHYDGVYDLPNREQFDIWMLDSASVPLAQPFLLNAPFLDARPIKFDKKPKEGDTLTWREYQFRFHHLPGQSYFTMGVETTIDGKRCYFTADNFFHQDMYSGSGGWMGLNRSWPVAYGESAKKVLDAAPDWVLAEHGGPFEFNAEDFRRRVLWGKAAGEAADKLCVTGNHRLDWDPNLIHAEPLLQQAKAGGTIKVRLVISNPLDQKRNYQLGIASHILTNQPTLSLEVPAKGVIHREVELRLKQNVDEGRHIIVIKGAEPADAFFGVGVSR